MGGGSGAGSTDLASIPGHLIAVHQALLEGEGTHTNDEQTWNTTLAGGGILQHLDSALLAGTPWDTITSFDPTENLALIDSEFATFAAAISEIDPETNWAAFVEQAYNYADMILEDGGNAEASVDAYRDTLTNDFAREMAAARATLYANNASEGSALPMMMAIMRKGFLARIAAFRAEMRRNMSAQKAAFVAQAVTEMSTTQRYKVEASRLAAIIRNELQVVAMNALREEKNDSLEYALKRQTFRLGLFANASNTLAAYSGAASVPLGPSKLSTALSSALSGAATGVSVGAQGGPGTAALGGFVGGLLGFASGRT